MKLLTLYFLVAFCCVLITAKALNESSKADNEEIEALDLLKRITRQAASTKPVCKYRKGAWSACDPQTKVRTRTFTLKKGDKEVCENTKVLRKECKGKKEGGKQRNKSNNRQNKNRDRQRNNNNNN